MVIEERIFFTMKMKKNEKLFSLVEDLAKK